MLSEKEMRRKREREKETLFRIHHDQKLSNNKLYKLFVKLHSYRLQLHKDESFVFIK